MRLKRLMRPMAALLAAPFTLSAIAQQPEGGTAMQRDPLDPAGIRSTPLQLGGQQVTSGTAFNPAISVIVDGLYYNAFSGHAEEPAGFDAHDHGHGHGHGHEHGLSEGFNLREVEIAFSASIDNYFDAMVMLAIENASEIELEEAYLTTRALPAGLQLKFGRFLSDVGYINKQHLHDWSFVDRPMVNEFLFGDHGLQDNGVQLSFVPATPFYTRLGVEVLQGSGGIAQYEGSGNHEIVTMLPGMESVNGGVQPVPGEPQRIRWRADNGLRDRTGPRLFTAFATFAPNLGYEHAAQFGLSGGYASAWQNVVAHSSGRLETWDGDAWFAGVDAVYKYDGGGALGHRNLTLQAEYFYREIAADYASRVFSDFSTLEPTAAGGMTDVFSGTARQDGLYAQAVYGIAPRWQLGVRGEALGMRNRTLEADRANNAFESFGTSYRWSGNLTFRPTEFSAVRAQVNYNDFATEDDHHGDGWGFMLQFNMSMGVHGAHQF